MNRARAGPGKLLWSGKIWNGQGILFFNFNGIFFLALFSLKIYSLFFYFLFFLDILDNIMTGITSGKSKNIVRILVFSSLL